MRLSSFSIILFFVCLNLSLYMMNQTGVLGDLYQPPYEEPEDITSTLIHLDTSGTSLLIGGSTIAVGIIIGYLTGHLIYGGAVSIFLFTLNLFLPVLRWVLFGFPVFLQQIGVPTAIWTTVNVLMAVVWFWFILGFIAQRTLEK